MNSQPYRELVAELARRIASNTWTLAARSSFFLFMVSISARLIFFFSRLDNGPGGLI